MRRCRLLQRESIAGPDATGVQPFIDGSVTRDRLSHLINPPCLGLRSVRFALCVSD
jgi:hypothetical protein